MRIRKELKCSECAKTYIKWQGICDGCGKGNTLTESTLTQDVAASQRRLRRRAKDSERNIAKRMSAVDGMDPAFSRIASSTGRTGHISGMRVDSISRTYVIENKNRKMPTWLITAWILIQQKGDEYNKNILLHVEPPNMPRDYPSLGIKRKSDTMAIITQTRHEELIQKEKLLSETIFILSSDVDNKAKLQIISKMLNSGEPDKTA